jgi:hypothetical protein
MGVRQSSVLAWALVMLAAASIGIANAAVPVFPNNIVAFPQRDFVTLEGYSELKGQNLTVEVVRAGVVIGSAIGKVSGLDVAFEVNHPGGYCWGAGTGLDVTPDIKHGDMVQLRKTAEPVSTFFQDMVVKHAECSGPGEISTDKLSVAGSNSDDNVVIIKGVYSGAMDFAFTEQRVVNPDLKTTAVGRRDIRAVQGAVAGTFEAADGYSSKLVFDKAAGTFTATYIFTNTAVTQGVPQLVISGGGERLLSWMAADGDGNRQGITIAELGESGGPGLGGCPQGPSSSAPPAGSYTTASISDTTASVMWTPQTAGADAAAVTGYFVSATHLGPDGADYLKTGPMKIVNGSAAKECSMPVDKQYPYEFEVRSLSGAGDTTSPYKFSAPFKYVAPAKQQAPVPDGKVGTPPSDLSVEMAGPSADPKVLGQITLTSPDAKSEIYWNIDGPAAVGGSTALDATLYTGPFFPPADFVDGKQHVIHWVVYVTAPGEPEASATGQSAALTFPSAGPPTSRSKPEPLTYTSTSDGFEAKWGYINTDADLKSFTVKVYSKTTSELLRNITGIPPSERSAKVTGLPIDTTFEFAVIPEPAAEGAVHARAEAKSLPVVKITISGATWKSGDLRWVVNAPDKMDITLYGGNATAPDLTTSIFSLPTTSPLWTAPVPPATSWTADCRVRTGPAATTDPKFIWGVYAGGKGREKGATAVKGRKLRF